MKMYEYDAGHMTKMAAMPKNGKKPFKNLLRNQQDVTHEASYVELGTPVHHS